YCFLLSIELMGVSFESFGSGFTHFFNLAVSDPLAGLVAGIVVTSIVQSSSMTTSIVVAMVGAGTISLQYAIPIIMGANIGTTVTNTIVSFAYVGRRNEFEPAFGASIVHDVFNTCAVLLFFPLQVTTGFLQKSAEFLTGIFKDVGGFTFASPLKYILDPVSSTVSGLVPSKILLLLLALVFLFFSLSQVVKSMKGMIMQKVETLLNQYLFRNMLVSLLFGLALTATIQSSSIATSIIVPLVAAGLLTIEQIFPYTLGANIGTTVTAILAALGVGTEVAMAVAFAHLLFNFFGICVFLPLKHIPIWIARKIAHFASASKRKFFVFLTIYVMFHIVIVILIFI
ncbi:MAG: Na/Pi symporter, partial [Candidatus Latescibacterota bacterium]